MENIRITNFSDMQQSANRIHGLQKVGEYQRTGGQTPSILNVHKGPIFSHTNTPVKEMEKNIYVPYKTNKYHDKMKKLSLLKEESSPNNSVLTELKKMNLTPS